MAISSATIASNALAFLGEHPILTILDESVRARLCNQHFEIVRDALLAEHPWNFPKARVTLAALSVTAPVFDYSYTFALPSDYLRMVKVFPDYAEFEIEGNTLVSDVSEIRIVYVKRLTDYNRYNPLFILAFEYKLAAAIAPVLKQDPKITEAMEMMGDKWLSKAKIADAQEERSVEVLSDELVTVRKIN